MMQAEKPVLSQDSRQLSTFFKGIAILMVILTHSHIDFQLNAAVRAVPRFGQMGCQVFFVLSAFGLCHSFSGAKPGWAAHMKKRIEKLAAGYWPAIVLYAVYRAALAVLRRQSVLAALHLPGVLINALFLNGLVPDVTVNNTIVRGGWYIGTTVVLYALFPFLYRLYFSSRFDWWKKHRRWLFLLLVFGITSGVMIGLTCIDSQFYPKNNSFWYFSFVNQLTPFSVGLVLFDVYQSGIRLPGTPAFSALFLAVSVWLFFANVPFAFVFCPTAVAVSFSFFYLYCLQNQVLFGSIQQGKNRFVRVVCRFGEISYAIYLTHVFIAFDFSRFCLAVLHRISRLDIIWYCVLFFVELVMIYYVGLWYNKLIQAAAKIRAKK